MQNDAIDRDIEGYLMGKYSKLDEKILDIIEKKRKKFIVQKNEQLANFYWCMKQVFCIHDDYLKGYYGIRNHLYERAWNYFDRADIALGALMPVLDNRFKVKDPFHIQFIQNIIKEYVKLFPYMFFFSREGKIKKECCSICGTTIRFRGGCEHKIGQLYMGEMCHYEVMEYEITGFAIVEHPFDRYAFLKPVGRHYNYEMLDMVVSHLDSPYERWHVDTSKTVLKKEFVGLGRNDKCPCNSGKKFKKCCYNTERMYTTHYDIVYDDKNYTGIISPLRYTSTYK